MTVDNVCSMPVAILDQTHVKNIGHFEICCDRAMYLKNETCLSEAEVTEAIDAAQSVLDIIQKYLYFRVLKNCTLMHFDLKSGKKVLIKVRDQYWSEWKVLDDERAEKWNLYLDEKDRLEEEAERKAAEEQGIEYAAIVDSDDRSTCLMHSHYLSRTYIKEIGHFQVSCDRPMYLKRETVLSDCEEKETMDAVHRMLDASQKHFFFETLKTIQFMKVWTKRDKLVLVQIKPEYWKQWKEAEDRRL
ncbi:hypothetical protein EMPS_06986 [Entomortierella parvispora]|uniref:Uncharacterized protein n=1 Tax=Entomortierella parvispora TaxID=205924 RepID=A0A9P3HE16_9FUNG|nr:hypothetical protein EMPS_06986 [Entomortierella parvispora]